MRHSLAICSARLLAGLFLRMYHTVCWWNRPSDRRQACPRYEFRQSLLQTIARVGNTTGECGRIAGTRGVLAREDGLKWKSMQRIASWEERGGRETRSKRATKQEGDKSSRTNGKQLPKHHAVGAELRRHAHLVYVPSLERSTAASSRIGAHPNHRDPRVPA